MNREDKRLTSSLNNKAHRIAKGIYRNPNIAITNLSNRVLSNEEDKVGSSSLKHGAATNAASAFAEDIFDRAN